MLSSTVCEPITVSRQHLLGEELSFDVKSDPPTARETMSPQWSCTLDSPERPADCDSGSSSPSDDLLESDSEDNFSGGSSSTGTERSKPSSHSDNKKPLQAVVSLENEEEDEYAVIMNQPRSSSCHLTETKRPSLLPRSPSSPFPAHLSVTQRQNIFLSPSPQLLSPSTSSLTPMQSISSSKKSVLDSLVEERLSKKGSASPTPSPLEEDLGWLLKSANKEGKGEEEQVQQEERESDSEYTDMMQGGVRYMPVIAEEASGKDVSWPRQYEATKYTQVRQSLKRQAKHGEEEKEDIDDSEKYSPVQKSSLTAAESSSKRKLCPLDEDGEGQRALETGCEEEMLEMEDVYVDMGTSSTGNTHLH